MVSSGLAMGAFEVPRWVPVVDPWTGETQLVAKIFATGCFNFRIPLSEEFAAREFWLTRKSARYDDVINLHRSATFPYHRKDFRRRQKHV